MRKSKTNQYRERVHRLVLAGCDGHPLDPVAAVQRHIELNNPEQGDALFTFREAGKQQAMTHNILVSVTKLLFLCKGCDPSAVSGHSYRRGGATAAFQAGVPEPLVQRHVDWASLTVRIYAELSDKCRAKTTSAVFQAILNRETLTMVPAVTPWGHVGRGEVYGQLGDAAAAAAADAAFRR